MAHRVRARGPGEVLGLGFERGREAVGSGDILVMHVRESGGDVVERLPLTFRRASAVDAASYARDIGTDSATTFRARLSDDVRCYIVEEDGRLVHASWVTTSAAWTRELKKYLRPPPSDAYVYESFTRPETRGQGIYPFALTSLCATVVPDGIRRLWVAVEASNKPSLAAVAKAAFAPAFEVSYVKTWGRVTITAITGPHRAVAATFRSESPGP